MAGLVSEGTTVVDGATHILRGYEDFEEKLTALGATVAFEWRPGSPARSACGLSISARRLAAFV